MNNQQVRLVLAISIDGRLAMPLGGRTELGKKGDRRVLEEALAWSDGTLIGSGTLKEHQSTCLIHDGDLIKRRQASGRSSQPISVVISNQRQFSKNWNYRTCYVRNSSYIDLGLIFYWS